MTTPCQHWSIHGGRCTMCGLPANQIPTRPSKETR